MKIWRFLPKNRKLFYRWLLSYISILLIPVIISGIVSVFSERLMRNETNRANTATLKQIRQTIDEMTASFEKTAIQISINQSLRSVLSIRESYDGAGQYSMYTLMKQLGMYISINRYIDNIYIYFKYSDSVLSDTYRANTKYFYDNYLSDDNMSYEQFMELLNGQHMMDYYVIDTKETNDGKTRNVMFLQSLPLINSGNNMGTLIGVIPEEKFQKIINNLKWVEQSEFLIIGRNGDELLSNGPRVLSLKMILDAMVGNENKEYYNSKDGKNVITDISSDITRWKYVMIMPTDVFWAKTRFIRKMALYGILMCILAGGIVAYFLSKKKYDPIENITQALMDKRILPPGNKYKEYSFIQTAVNENINEIKTAQIKIEKQYSILKNKFLLELLEGKMSNEDLTEERFSSYGISFTGPNFAVLLFSMDNFSSYNIQEGSVSDSTARKTIKYTVVSVISRSLKEENRSYVVDMDENIFAFIINFCDVDMTANSKVLDDIVRECREILEEKMHVSFVASISNLHEGISEIPEAYTEVKDAMEYRKLICSSGITRYEDIDNPRYSYDYSFETEQKFINYMKTGDFDKCRNVFEEVLKSNLYDSSFSGEMAKCLMFDITSTIVKTMYEICDITVIEDIQPIKRLLKCSTIVEMKTHIIIILKEVCKHVKKNGMNNCQLSNAVLEYIKSNYFNNDLNVSTISMEFNITQPYLSKLFKEQTGQNLFDTINRFRVEKAKMLLKDDKLSIADTAARIGFSNSSVFIRTFRKYEGITPGDYKDI